MSEKDGVFEAAVSRYYERFQKGDEDYFQLLDLSNNATQRQIEEAYTKKIETEFPRSKIEPLPDKELKEKAVYILQRIDYMYTQLIDYEKRAQYNKTRAEKSAPEEKPVQDAKEQARSNYKLGKSLYEQKMLPMAMSALQEAVKLDPTKAEYFHQLALCQVRVPKLGREAEENLKTAIKLEPWNGGHHAALGMFYLNVNMKVRAKSCFKQALSLDSNNVLAKKGIKQLGPQEKPSLFDTVHKILKKALPSFFDKG